MEIFTSPTLTYAAKSIKTRTNLLREGGGIKREGNECFSETQKGRGLIANVFSPKPIFPLVKEASYLQLSLESARAELQQAQITASPQS